MDTKAIAILVDGTKVRGRLTTEHAASSFNQPVFVDDNGQAYNWAAIAEIISTAAASKAGSVSSDKKTAAVRENGKKGGRPRKLDKTRLFSEINDIRVPGTKTGVGEEL